MSYEISYRRQAFVMPATQAGHYDDLLFLIEETGSNNCWEFDNRRRARSWGCLSTGAAYECLAEATRLAAACCGGSLVLYGRRPTTPEAYIRAWRKTIAEAIPIQDAPRMGFSIALFTRMSDPEAETERKYAFEQLSGQTAIKSRRAQNTISSQPYTEWRFDLHVPEQVKLWYETRTRGRGWYSVDVNGPD